MLISSSVAKLVDGVTLPVESIYLWIISLKSRSDGDVMLVCLYKVGDHYHLRVY